MLGALASLVGSGALQFAGAVKSPLSGVRPSQSLFSGYHHRARPTGELGSHSELENAEVKPSWPWKTCS